MIDSQKTNPDGVALKEYLEKQLDGQRAYFESRIIALEKATEVAAKVLGDRLSSMNEIRGTMNDLSVRMATRDELTIQLKQITDDIKDLKRSRDEATGKASQTSVLISMAIGLVGLILAVVNMLTK